MAGNPPADVQDYGQSIWLDYIHRKDIENGTMQEFIDDYGVVGVTSNPSIFQKAIGASDSYDDAISTMLDLDAHDIYERLAIADIQRATDLFRPIYDRTGGADGYVSLEVSPLLANNTQQTIAEAKRLHDAVDRPNLMIKIPGTAAGLPAVEETIANGINVNVTLIFAIKNYEGVAEAYIRGLERRLEAGKDVGHLASVASFFLSRIDTLVDRMLENNIRAAQVRGDTGRIGANRELLGTAAIASAKLAYRSFNRIFNGPRFAKLKAAGARVQRPLWASTSTKNPAYPDTLYIDSLIGEHTVNTVPPATLKAFKDHGKVGATLISDPDGAGVVMEKLAEMGVDMGQVTQQLQDDGVEAFIKSFEDLINQVATKRAILKTGVMQRQKIALGIYADAVQETMDSLDKEHAAARIWSKDGSLWKSHTPTINQIVNSLGWLDVKETIDIARLQKLQDSVRDGQFTHVVLLGMGGSSLAPEVFSLTFGSQKGFPELLVLDSTNPARIRDVEAAIDLKKTLFLVSSKSGGTIETLSFYRYFYDRTGGKGDQFIAITDPGSGLEQIAKDKNFRDLFLNPTDIGGRYSALSYFGMVPAALIGLDLHKLWERAGNMMEANAGNIRVPQHPGASVGAVMGALGKQGRDKVTVICTSSISSFGNWVEQLIAESTGKEDTGLLPVVGGTVGKPHDYGSDRLFIYLKVDGDPDMEQVDTGVRTLREAGHPRVTIILRDKYDIAGEFFRWEFATAVAGRLYGINPFDQPNVTEAKEMTGRLLEVYEDNGSLPDTESVLEADGVQMYADERTLAPLRELCAAHGYDSSSLTEVLAAQMIGTHSGDYFALLAYVDPTAAAQDALEDVRRRIRHVTRRAVTLGFGPRYLHSTGQFHKGGPNSGIFLQITSDADGDIAIPGAPYGFTILHTAQADGDLQALYAHGRRAIRLHFSGDLSTLTDKLKAAVDFAEERRA